jgi:methionine sulfoxide reductase heme-binding subunit
MIIAAANYAWYAARAGGMLAFVLLTSSVVAGLRLSSRDRLKHWPRFALEDVHRFLGLLAGSFIVLHGGALLLDSYLPFTLGSLLIPGTAPFGRSGSRLGSSAPSCWSPSRSRTTTGSSSGTPSGSAPTT